MRRFNLWRSNYAPEYTEGRLYFGQQFLCWTLEEPWLDNLRNVSCVYEGLYPLTIRTDGDRGPRYELQDVPARSNVQIHSGNDLHDTTGCILVGVTREPGKVWSSRKAMNMLLAYEFTRIKIGRGPSPARVPPIPDAKTSATQTA